MGSSLREKKNGGSEDKIDERVGVFLEVCYLCKKRLAQDQDVFMYGNLQAFCTPECRDEQIALDKKDRKPSRRSTATEEPAKQGFGSQAKRQAVARFK
ncbi:hypothetical protein F0562_034977 [Nyssa sinensis]|uniref:FLZ-type domain-containing protein n=1 Tax=Nyssa sinensis TaxID=561372 RepID=A0A5J5AC12_9ASTE|nr:hypothetical protein F0562_034977 [Nyssa sinensis]